MKVTRITSLLVVLCCIFNTAWTADWSYEGDKGADRWADHHKDCGGEKQSPINIKTDISQFDPYLSDITVYSSEKNPGRMILIHNGHTLQVNTKGDHYVYGGKLPSNYRVAQFHLHWGKHDHRGSEHMVDGHHFPMELHIVAYDFLNYNTIGQAMKSPMGLAVLGTLFTISDKDNPALEPIISAVKHVRDPDEKYTTDITNLELRDLLPNSLKNYYRYNGSLTTPGCFESVLWTVFEETKTISHRQIQILRDILRSAESHSHHGNLKITERVKLVDNFRPVQPLNGRQIYRSFAKRGDLPTASLKTQHWSYKGDTGPMKWHDMYPDGGCGGVYQSPINIPEHETKFSDKLTVIQIESPAPETNPQMTVLNNGHTIKVTVGDGAGDYYVRGGGLPDNAEYLVAQLHFHWGGEDNKGSEHHVNGHAYPIELHVVTYDSRNYASIQAAAKQHQGLAVLGVLFEVVHDDNLALQPLEDVMERVADPEQNNKVAISALDLNDLLPDDTSQYFRYNGSLTTPGCYESVVWTVFKMTQTLSHKQLRQFREVLKHQDDHGEVDKVLPSGEGSPGHGAHVDDTLLKVGDVLRERLIDNYRPIQPVNNRTILRSYQITGSKRRKGGSHGHHWSYTGNNGPDHWHTMTEGCNGVQQSPIDIIISKTEYNPRLPGFTLTNSPSVNSEMSVVNNGHTVQVNIKGTQHYVDGGGLPSTYETLQLHFHWGSSDDKGSEHTVDGQAFPLELHVVNYDAKKYSDISEAVKQPQGLAVLGTFFYISDSDNTALRPILDGFAHVRDPEDKVKKVIQPFFLEGLLPADTSKYYRYNGSLTTPGCFESVIWTVFKDKVPISAQQMSMFRDILLPDEDKRDKGIIKAESGSHGHEPSSNGNVTSGETNGTKPVEIGNSGRRAKMVDNFRPVQPLNERKVWRSFKLSAERRKKKTKHWSYEGAQGPDKWASLYPDKNCDGTKQSPINIARNETNFDPQLRELNIWYDPPLPGSKMVATNNGHTVKVALDGKYFVTGAGLTKVYKSAQFHFHWGSSTEMGSEHTVDNQAFPLELHIVNYDSESYSSITEAISQPMGLAVLGVFYTVSTEDNPTLQRVIEALEHIGDANSGKEVEIEPISVKYFLPQDKSRYYRYNGSLTTPGCYESVIWTVFEDTQSISRKQLEKFWNMFQMDHDHMDHGPKYNANNHKPANQTDPSGGPVVVEKPGTSSTHTRKRKGRKRIKTNFRPVQAINERQVYRSFETFDAEDKGRVASSKMCSGTSKISNFPLHVLILISLSFKFFSQL